VLAADGGAGPQDGAGGTAACCSTFMSDRLGARSESFASLLQSRIALVAAHPNDEILGLGGCLAQIPTPIIIHVTDGTPRELAGPGSGGFTSREEYACARRLELDRALAAASVSHERRLALCEADQEAVFHLADLTRELIPVLASVEWVITHPYEGGHPDHDAAAFIVQAACARLRRAIGRAPQRLEFASYHARDGQIVRGQFWPDPACPESAFTLDASQKARKRAALSKFVTQRSFIAAFPTEVERLRPAPRYDFSAPPPPGVALYDRFGWSVHSALWRCEAVRALESLELRG
jgi:N-acetylglucosamine malate deacetylase 2